MAAEEATSEARARRLAEELAAELLGSKAYGSIEFPVSHGVVRIIHRKSTLLVGDADLVEDEAAAALRALVPGLDEVGGVDGPGNGA